MDDDDEDIRSNRSLHLPPSISAPGGDGTVVFETSVVVVGANGSGKTRMGTWLQLEGPEKGQVHRIPAQRSIVFPKRTSPRAVTDARSSFLFADRPDEWSEEYFETAKRDLWLQRKFAGSIVNAGIVPADDFDALNTLIFSEHVASLHDNYEKEEQSGKALKNPATVLTQLQNVWQRVLPNRTLSFEGLQARAASKSGTGKLYPASDMSDGERVVYYLIGQCVCAPVDSIVVVDEPEIHLHRAIQSVLWNAIEQARPDCSFVYITHDLDFAADRPGSVKVCLREFVDGQFDWFVVPDQQQMPESIYLEVLGSRRPVLFVEGINDSHDLPLYQLVYPDFTVKALGGCDSVIAATKAFRSRVDMHHNQCFGLIDRDHRTTAEIEALMASGIYCLPVAEVENLYLLPEVVRAVAKQLVVEDARKTLQAVKAMVFKTFKSMIEAHAQEETQHIVELKLRGFSASDTASIEDYEAAWRVFCDEVDPSTIYANQLAQATALHSSKDYLGVLLAFNHKALIGQAGKHFEIQGSYVDKVLRIAKKADSDILKAIRKQMPDLALELST